MAGITDFNALASGPSGSQFLAAWKPVAAQLAKEGVSPTDFDYTSAQGAFADAVNQLGQAAQGISGSDALAAAQKYVIAGKTAYGAVSNVAGLLQSAQSMPTPQLVTSFTGTLVGTGVQIAVGAGVITAGVGAAIVGAVSGLLSILSSAGLFGGAPQVSGPQPNFTISTVGPTGAIGQGWMFQLGDHVARVSPNDSIDWRNFPDPNSAADRIWFLPWGDKNNAPAFTWANGTWVLPVANAVGTRPIDIAFPAYRTMECNLAQVGQSDPLYGLVRAFFAAWKLNAAYVLNGLKPQDDSQVLLHTLRLFNRAHLPGTTTSLAPVTGDLVMSSETCTPSDPVKSLYIGMLVEAARANASSEDSALIDGSGNLLVNTGALRQFVKLTPGGAAGDIGGMKPGSGSTAIKTTGMSTGAKVAIGTGAVAATAAGGAALYGFLTGQGAGYLFGKAIDGLTGLASMAGESAAGGFAAMEDRSSMQIQSLLFPRAKFTVSEAKKWARDHGYAAPKVDITNEYIRIRQRSPSDFKTMRTISLGSSGVRAVVGR